MPPSYAYGAAARPSRGRRATTLPARARGIGRVTLTLLTLILSQAPHAHPHDAPVSAPVQADIDRMATLRPGESIAGFRVAARFDGVDGRPAGMRFLHEPTGMPVDLLRFDSIPQAMIWVETPPNSDRGEPHTGEHLVLGKGRKARYAALLLDMSMGSSSASTHRDKTVYHFHTAGGRQSFLELTYRFLDALVHTDVTDEEIRREVAHLGVVADPETGQLELEEKGTVYLEMVSSFEKPGTIVWSEVRRRLYGPGHPLGLESGGRPEAIRTMRPEQMRAFFDHRYRPGETMGLILGLPPHFELDLFLSDLNGILRKVANGWGRPAGAAPDSAAPDSAALLSAATDSAALDSAATAAAPGTAGDPDWPSLADLPAPRPPAKPQIVRLPFPSANSTEPGPVVIGWAPFDRLSPQERFRLEVLWHIYSGDEASYVYQDLIDGTLRKVSAGIGDASGWINSMPGHCPMLWLSGVSPQAMTPEALAEVRRVLTERLAWIAGLAPGSAALATLHEKARTHLLAGRRFLIEQTEAPPRFGYRGTGDFWYRHLREIMRQPGFAKDLLQEEQRAALLRDLEQGNPWGPLIERLGLDSPPAVIVAAYPDLELPGRQAAEKQARLQARLADLLPQYETGEAQEALRRYQAEFDAQTQLLRRIEEGIGRPGFLNDPPLTLDDTIDSRIEPLTLTLADGRVHSVPICLNRFGRTTLIDAGLYFDAGRVTRDQWIYLAILPQIISDLGCWSPDTPEGAAREWISYADLRERLRRDVSQLNAAFSTAPRETGSRIELAVYGTGLGIEEGRAALAWMRRLLASAAELDSSALPRLRDLVTREIAMLKQLPLRSEEDWVDNPARAYREQSDPILLSATAQFTRLHHLQRLHWRLQPVPADDQLGPVAVWVNDTLAGWDRTRAGLYAALDSLAAGVARRAPPAARLAAMVSDHLRGELEDCPDETLETDFMRLAGEALGDLLVPPEQVLAGMRQTIQHLSSAGPTRAHLTAGTENMARLKAHLDVTVAGLMGSAATAAPAPEPAMGPATGSTAWNGPGPGLISANLRDRYPWIRSDAAPPPYAALVMESSRSAVFVNSARAVSYDRPYLARLVDVLAARVFGGAGAHGLFMQTWGAGLAYSNGVGANPRRGLVSYYAERCGNGVETLRFVGGLLDRAEETLSDDFYLDYALAGCFGDYRGGQTYLQRGRAMANDWADDLTPEKIRTFKEALLQLRRRWQEPNGDRGEDRLFSAGGLLPQVAGRLPHVIGPVVPGYGLPADAADGVVNFMIGPASQIDAFEDHLAAHEPEARIVRLYPRDFWLD